MLKLKLLLFWFLEIIDDVDGDREYLFKEGRLCIIFGELVELDKE